MGHDAGERPVDDGDVGPTVAELSLASLRR